MQFSKSHSILLNFKGFTLATLPLDPVQPPKRLEDVILNRRSQPSRTRSLCWWRQTQLSQSTPLQIPWWFEGFEWIYACSAYYAKCACYALLMNDSKITWLPIAASFCSSSKATAVSRLLRDDFLIPRGLFPTLKIKKKIVKEQSCSTECPFRCKCLLIAFLAPSAHIHYHLLARSIEEGH